MLMQIPVHRQLLSPGIRGEINGQCIVWSPGVHDEDGIKKKLEKKLGDLKEDILHLAKIAEKDGEEKKQIASIVAHALREYVSRGYTKF